MKPDSLCNTVAPLQDRSTADDRSADREYDVMVAGHLCLDIIPRFPDGGITDLGSLIRPGKLVNVQHAVLSTGGPVSNTGITMKTMGMRVCFCARVGDDEFGMITADRLRRAGNADGIRAVEGASSSYTVVLAPPYIDRVFLHNPGTNDQFAADDLDLDLVAKCRHLHFGYPPLMRRMFEDGGDNLRRLFQSAKRAGATTSCDMSLPDPASDSGRVDWRRVLERALPYVDIFLPSIEETLFMLEPERFHEMRREHGTADILARLAPDDYSRLANMLLDMGTKVVCLKSGHRGIYLKTGAATALKQPRTDDSPNVDDWSDRELWTPAFRVEKVVSATGSGDASIAGFLTAYLRNQPVEDCLRYAVGCGMQNVAVLDAVGGARSWEETTRTILQPLPTIEPGINDPRWTWSESRRLWSGPEDRLSLLH